jgi:pyruvate-ferredoxin/flavodoxin oxidoreductase
MKGMHFRIQVGVMDCLGCGNCVDVCPGNPKTGKALSMVPLEGQEAEAANWNYCAENVKSKQDLVDIKSNVKNSQFATPLFEFSGACSGCGETPYVKLIAQLFGDRQIAANATGCTSIYSGSVPSTPYTTNEKGHGPAWSNSLFEDFNICDVANLRFGELRKPCGTYTRTCCRFLRVWSRYADCSPQNQRASCSPYD